MSIFSSEFKERGVFVFNKYFVGKEKKLSTITKHKNKTKLLSKMMISCFCFLYYILKSISANFKGTQILNQ